MPMLPNCPSGAVKPPSATTYMAGSPSGAATHTTARFQPRCPTAIRGVTGGAFVVECPSGAVTHIATAFQPACPTGVRP